MIECTYALCLEKSVAKVNPGVPRGWKKTPEESEDHQNANAGVSNVEISRGTPGFGVFEEPLGIPSMNSNNSTKNESQRHLLLQNLG